MSKIGDFLVRKFDAVTRDGVEYQMRCPKCFDKKRHLGINIEVGVSNCFRCSFKPVLRELLVEYGGLSFSDVQELLGETVTKVKVKSDEVKIASLPDGYERLENVREGLGVLSRLWLQEQRIDEDSWEELQLGVVIKKNSNYFGRLIIPVLDDRKVVYWLGRALLDTISPKYMFPDISRSNVLWGMNYLSNERKEVFITEGWKDAYRVKGIALLGSSMSEGQIEKLQSRLGESVVVSVMLDRDAWGKGFKIANNLRKIVKNDIRLYLLHGEKDPGDCSSKGEAIQQSYVYSMNSLSERVRAKLKVESKGGVRI